ncbi:MAG: transglycosylase SLT domain-containing protein [Desulforhopalus sp.]|nr:transglycosylase SLT domain-containing protein [Desulforhopalus sp.]
MTATALHRIALAKPLLYFTLLWSLLFFTTAGFAQTTSQIFPQYPTISKNVQFWEKIYAVYSLRQAVIHDSEDLSKIYQVVTLADPNAPGGRQQNTIIQKQACERYSAMLSRLAIQPPSSAEEQRVAALFTGKNARQDMALAANTVRSQSGQKERFLAGVIASRPYIAEIRKILRSYDLPEELAHLPHVESSFNFRAYSRIGAAGLWQFTRETGKQYMTIDHIIDERLDPITATHAAAKYLAKSYRTLNNWPLAITSYNYGLGGTMRAVNEEGSYERIFTNYNKGYFKFAARNFYPEFLAAKNVATYVENNYQGSHAVESRFYYLRLPGYVHIRDISRHFGLPVEVIEDINPALRPPIISGDKLIPKGYTLRLPAGGKTNQLVAALSSSLFKNDQKSSQYHLVRKGDTVNSIARLYKVSLKSLAKANNLEKISSIRPGQSLLLPGKAEASIDNDSRTKTGSTRINVQRNLTTKETLPPKEV